MNDTIEVLSPVPRLREIVGDAQVGHATARARLDALLEDTEAIEALGRATGSDKEAILRYSRQLSEIRGYKTRHGALVQKMRQARARSHSGIQLVADGTLTMSSALQHCTPPERIVAAEILEEMIVPQGYWVSENGVFKVTLTGGHRLISLSPILITRRSAIVQTGDAERTLAWLAGGRWVSATVGRAAMVNAHNLVTALGGKDDAPVHSGNSREVIEYLVTLEQTNRHVVPSVIASNHLGWHDDGSFLLPDVHLRGLAKDDPEPLEFSPQGDLDIARGVTSAGTWEGWLEAAAVASQYPFMMVGLYFSIGSIFLHLLNLPAAMADFSGQHGSGKSTTLRFAASPWGNTTDDGGYFQTWDTTWVGLEQRALELRNLPMIVDDTKNAKHASVPAQAIYNFSGGRTRVRGAKGGGTQSSGYWRCYMESSGETAITDLSKDAGAVDRAMCFRGAPSGYDPEKGARDAEFVERTVAAHHGHLGRRVVEKIAEIGEGFVEQLQAAYEEERKLWSDGAHGATAQRLGKHAALAEVTRRFLEQHMGVPACPAVPQLLRETIAEAEPVSDRPAAALVELVGEAFMRQASFYGRHDTSHGPPQGSYVGAWDAADDWGAIYFLPSTIQNWLQARGYNEWLGILDSWNERGWLLQPPERASPLKEEGARVSPRRRRAKTVRRSVKGGTVGMYAIHRSAYEAAMKEVPDVKPTR